ncbi:phosphonate C-P lyase system protein PhnL [Desulfovibrio litoralis]|uniref:Alpha-D-ribose 1-methylphosphonate 5-triphosphate synthase subunit PhnL n=1 Tax=Desulfovibrio litoralis DSM 11393 TaxID=1121455 RepID=A0A1M7SSQ8_9BACT|nr:phosphonate C-P lyase system protein PhnL [Desulfovibrio litoralis]SHN61522.1 alpha-D-ribose 1-methylphosphonate 5-triphosphate synthase subunit PhnL [Desulfovibrio litoralis DSM 11393]
MLENNELKPSVIVEKLYKEFILHTQGGIKINAFTNLNLKAFAGKCLALHGQSGAGKSTLLRSIYANYKPCSGKILIKHQGDYTDIVSTTPRTVLNIRKDTMGYVSQFLRVIPRVSSLNIVAEQLTTQGETYENALKKSAQLLERLRIPKRLWNLAPATFSGGEQQRINIARGFIRSYPILLLDEPTASLDALNRQTVIELIQEAKLNGTAVIGIFHDAEVRDAVADDIFEMQSEVSYA